MNIGLIEVGKENIHYVKKLVSLNYVVKFIVFQEMGTSTIAKNIEINILNFKKLLSY